MRPYLDLLHDVVANGVRKPTRAVLASTGEPIDAVSVFGRQVRYDLAAGFPLVTTKKVDFDAVFHELRWFLLGRTDVGFLNERGIRIWDAWADEAGDLGPIYGAQWRRWPAGDGGEIDQIADLVAGIRKTAAEPGAAVGRRLVLSAWNVGALSAMRLPPCHVMAVFNVTKGQLSCMLVQRSADCVLGVPYNVASYALLTHLLARSASLGVGTLVHAIADAHVYVNHLPLVAEQLEREPLPPPWLDVVGPVDDPADVGRERVRLIGYAHHPALRGEVAV